MRSIFLVGLLALGMDLSAQSAGRVAERISHVRENGTRFQPISLLQRLERSAVNDALWSEAVTFADVLQLDAQATVGLLRSPEEFILMEIPSGAGNLHLELQRTEITSDDFVLRTSDGNAPPLAPNVHYRGMIQGQPGSVASISIFEGEVMGIISDQNGERIIGRFDKAPNGVHVLYHEDHLRSRSNAVCHTPDDGPNPEAHELQLQEGERTTKCIRLYWEGAYDITQNKGSVGNATNYLLGLFNQSATLFDNDGIDVELSELFIWSSASPYTATSSGGRLDQFGAHRTSFNGDLAHLIDLGNYGGIAWLNTICSSSIYRMAYSGINSSYQNVPTYSWSVEVVTHETGHNMGSKHTHACAWNGNNTAIDGCGQSAGYSEGSCPTGPIPSSSVGGTIMSYCHLTNTTIKFANGFGPQPTALITNKINSGSCLIACGTTCDAPLPSVSVGVGTATISWAGMGATNYDLQWKLSSSGTWTSVNGITGTSHQLTGLSNGTSYDYRVRSNCGTTTSGWSSTSSFTTPVPCTDPYEPNNGTASATPITLPSTLNALVGSTSDVDYFSFTTDQTSNITISLSNLAGDYDLRLLNSVGSQVAISQNGGTQSETISYTNAAAGTYFIHVYGWNGAHSTSVCYTLYSNASGAQGCGVPFGATASAITTTSAFLSWNAMQGAGSYGMQWRTQGLGEWNTVGSIAGTSYQLNGLSPGTQYEFRIRANCTGGSSLYSGSAIFTTVADPCATGARVTMFVWLDGAYNNANGLMRDDLRIQGLIPLNEPYSATGLPVEGITTTTMNILNITGSTAIVDWVVVELRNPANATQVLGTRAGLLRRDGRVVDPSDGVSPLNFCIPAGTYHVAVRHRNHLGCMTSAPMSISSGGSTIDLRTNSTFTYGTNGRRNVNGVMRLWAGNVNGDHQVKYSGTNNDRDIILTMLGGVVPSNTISGYLVADLNLDGVVKYTGQNNDRDIILSTIGGVVPTIVVTQQLP